MTDDLEKQIQKYTTELEAVEKEVNALKVKLNAAKDEKEYRDIRLSYDYNLLQAEKLQKKIEGAEKQKDDIKTELKRIDKQTLILECVLDAHRLKRDAKNFLDRKSRVISRIEKTLRERNEFDTLRTNLNKRWVELTKTEKPQTRLPYNTGTPTKDEELCEALCLKADAEVYFI